MDQIVLNSFREGSEKKYLYCDSCNSLLPAPGFYCVQCEPPQAPSLESEGDLTFSQAASRIVLLTILFLAIAVVKLDKYIMDGVSLEEKAGSHVKTASFKSIVFLCVLCVSQKHVFLR